MYFEFKHLKNIRFEVVELLISLTFALGCIFLYWFFPSKLNDGVENLMRVVFFLVLFPIAFVKIILQKNLTDLYIGRPFFSLKSILFLFIFIVLAFLGFLIIFKSSLFDYYKTKIFLVSNFKNLESFKIFLSYEVIFAVLLGVLIFFSFGFINFITKNFLKLNLILPPLFFYILTLIDSPFNVEIKESLIIFLMVLPTIFFRKIVNEQKSIWVFFSVFLILNIVFNAIIIKLSI